MQSLVEFPLVNARTDGISIWKRPSVHLGIAVSVPGGLLVPVVRDAQTLGIGALHDPDGREVRFQGGELA